tara:strand:+ start:17 stop:568 length:552 start_codon:yes stop_codon:yes gene_type:complete
MAELDVKKLIGLLESLGIGERGLNTPAENQALTGVMDTGKALNPLYVDNLEGIGILGQKMPKAFGVSQEEAVIKDTLDADISKLGIGQRGLDTPAEREFIMKQQAFETELTKLSSADLSSVLELFQGLSPQEKDTYMNHVIENGFNYGTINESAPLRQQGFPQYNTGTGNLSNLGFAGYGYAP